MCAQQCGWALVLLLWPWPLPQVVLWPRRKGADLNPTHSPAVIPTRSTNAQVTQDTGARTKCGVKPLSYRFVALCKTNRDTDGDSKAKFLTDWVILASFCTATPATLITHHCAQRRQRSKHTQACNQQPCPEKCRGLCIWILQELKAQTLSVPPLLLQIFMQCNHTSLSQPCQGCGIRAGTKCQNGWASPGTSPG